MSEFWYSIMTMLGEKGADYQSFHLFGTVHLTWLAIAAVAWIFSSILYKKLDEKGKRIMLISLAAFIVLYEIVMNIVYIATNQWTYGVLPLHLCGINIFVCAFYALKPNKLTADFLYGICLPGALFALATPSWTALPMWNFFHIHSEILHIILVMFPLLLLVDGFKPNAKNLWKLFLILIGMCVPLFFLNMKLGTNFFFVNNDDNNALLVAFGNIFPDYRIGLVLTLAVLWLAMFLPWAIIGRAKGKTQSNISA